jgi:hypothetical protein
MISLERDPRPGEKMTKDPRKNKLSNYLWGRMV